MEIDISKITRLEIIDPEKGGRQYTQWNRMYDFSIQDDGRTLKIFVSPEYHNG